MCYLLCVCSSCFALLLLTCLGFLCWTQALVSLAKIPHEGIQRDVVATLAHFSANGDMQVDVFPADIFMTIFDLAYSEEQLTARYAIMAICNLAVVGMNQVMLPRIAVTCGTSVHVFFGCSHCFSL